MLPDLVVITEPDGHYAIPETLRHARERAIRNARRRLYLSTSPAEQGTPSPPRAPDAGAASRRMAG
jgi:hypothetical protein